MTRPSTLAVMAAYQVLRPSDADPPLAISDGDYDVVRRALQAADRADPPISEEFRERLRIMRAVAIYRGAVTLQAAYIIAKTPRASMELVLESMGILSAAESHLGSAPCPRG